MPAIKKRITAEYLGREQRKEEAGGDAAGDGDKGNGDNGVAPPEGPAGDTVQIVASAEKSKAGKPRQYLSLKGLDAEVLFEKRKRTLAPAEQKLDTWLNNNLEKKADSSLPMLKLYKFYTDSCQLDSAQLVEMDHFKAILHNKFGKEFALKETSEYSGLLKESKPRKKPSVVSPSVSVKLRQFIDEALKASGNPSKGMIFSWIKKFISSNYPALQIELRPHVLRKALEKEVYAGRVELVRGIGLCGYYRQPGPPAVDEDQKGKKKPVKEKAEGESGDGDGDSANDVEDDAAKEGGDSAGDGGQDDAKTDKRKTKNVKGDSVEEDKEGKSDEESKKEEGEEVGKKSVTEEKKKRKRKKQGKKIKHETTHHSHPKMLKDIFPLAITYMAEPKEASFARIRKYLERYYGQADIDAKLKDCMEKGIKHGVWERVSGLGASGSFRLVVDSFNPSLAEDLDDMVTCAIVACNEPKTASVRLLKSYISEYHPDFHVERKPFLLKKALERAEACDQLRRISGIGLSGSFQLVKPFSPSPAILAGEEDDDDASDYDIDEAKQEVYVVRKTKSGRRAPLEKTQMDFSSSYNKNSRASSSSGRTRSEPGRGRPKTARGSPKKTISYAESSEEEEENEERSDEEPYEKIVDGYRPRPSRSRGSSSGSSKIGKAKTLAKKSASKTVSKTFKAKVADRTKARPAVTKKGKKATASKPGRNAGSKGTVASSEEEDQEEEMEEGEQAEEEPPVTKKGKMSTPGKKGRSGEEEEPEEELLVTKRGKMFTPGKPGKKGRSKETVASSEEEEPEEEEPPVTKKGKKSTTPGKKGRSKETVASSEEEEEPFGKGKKPTPGKPGQKGRSNEVEESEEEPPVAKKGKKATPGKPGQKGRNKVTVASSDEDEQEDEDNSVLETPKSAPRSTNSTPARHAAKPASRKRGGPSSLNSSQEKEAAKEAAEISDGESEDHYIIEEELPSPAKKKRSGTKPPRPGHAQDSAVAAKRGGSRKVTQDSSPPAGGSRTPRSASQAARRSLMEVESEAESEQEEDEYIARPSSTRGNVGKR